MRNKNHCLVTVIVVIVSSVMTAPGREMNEAMLSGPGGRAWEHARVPAPPVKQHGGI